MSQKKVVLELKNICMGFKTGDSYIEVLKDINFSINKGESCVLTGKSGSGKSTLLQIAALLEKPKSGDVYIHNNLVKKNDENSRTETRLKNIGFVYQFHNLLPELSALENVMIPQMILNKASKKEIEEKSKDLLDSVGLSHRISHFPKKLSGGEQQRVAIARALANDPDVIIADEPTGNLDYKTSEIVFELLMNMTSNRGMSIVMATHNNELSDKFDKKISLSDGKSFIN